MEALLWGKLVLADGYLRIEADSSTSYLPIWPSGFNVCSGEDGTIQVFNRNGHVVARVGEEVVMGGGECNNIEWLNNEIMKQPLPSSATGPFWCVGEGVHLNIRQDSKIFNIDIISVEDSTLLFLRSKPLLGAWVLDAQGVSDSWVQKKASITGELTFYGRSLYVEGLTVFWPSDYRASFQNGVITIVDQTDGTAIHVGDRVIVEGYKIFPTRDAHYLRLRDELPREYWESSFLVVSDIYTQIESPTPTATTTVPSTYQNLSVDEAKLLIQEEVNLVVLDVRTKEEYESGHLPNAILIPVAELQDRLAELDKDKKILVYCKTGIRSAKASQILVSHGFSSVYNLVGGIDAWIQADGPVVSDGGG